jgi:hypothetical protein
MEVKYNNLIKREEQKKGQKETEEKKIGRNARGMFLEINTPKAFPLCRFISPFRKHFISSETMNSSPCPSGTLEMWEYNQNDIFHSLAR